MMLNRWMPMMMVGGLSLGVAACGDTVDDTALEPSRETRVVGIAAAACDRFDECGEISGDDDALYGSADECRSDMEDRFYSLWPNDDCGAGQINNSKYEECVSRANNYSCDDNIFDFVSFYSNCNASDVCTDPRN